MWPISNLVKQGVLSGYQTVNDETIIGGSKISVIYGLEIVLATILFCLPSFIIEIYLENYGLARSDKFSTTISVFIIVIIKTIWFNDDSWWIWGIATIFASALSDHRYDL